MLCSFSSLFSQININDTISHTSGALAYWSSDYTVQGQGFHLNNGDVWYQQNIHNDGIVTCGSCTSGMNRINDKLNRRQVISGNVLEWYDGQINNNEGSSLETELQIKNLFQFTNGLIETDRSDLGQVLHFNGTNAGYIEDSPTSHVNGYAAKTGKGFFRFPIGNGNKILPVSLTGVNDTDFYQAAYFDTSPDAATLPVGAPFNTASHDPLITQVHQREYWDVDGPISTHIILHWDVESDLDSYISDIKELIIVGWDGLKWVNVGNIGTEGTLDADGWVRSEEIIPDFYQAFTFAVCSGCFIDSDNDTYTDAEEEQIGSDPLDPCDPDPFAVPELDCDADGLTNGEEEIAGTDPLDPCDPNDLVAFVSAKSICPEGQDGTGVITVDSVTGGIDPHYYALNSDNFIPTNTFEDLYVGDYTVKVQDVNGCITEEEIAILALESPELDIIDDQQNIELGSEFEIETAADKANIETVTWSPPDSLSCLDCIDPVANPSETTLYNLTIKDKNGCIAKDYILIKVSNDLHVYAPNVFSPNNDGANDIFTIYADEKVTEVMSLDIYDRWGTLIFTQKNFAPGTDLGWDGTFDGVALNQGVYVWKAEVLLSDGDMESVSGDITLAR